MLDPVPVRLQRYLDRHLISTAGLLGGGKDGSVWRTSRLTALKVHERIESYQAERDAYARLRDLQIRDIAGFAVPLLRGHDDKLGALEMDIVFPPFVVDFASARLDRPSELIEDEGHTLIDMIRERFDDRADEVIALYEELIASAGIYLSDFHPHNIKFAPP
jgi:hypothetical protein